MARLPVPGGDNGNWGTILNDYLSQTHNPDGTLKDDSVGSAQLQDNTVTAAQIADGTIQEAKLDSAVQTKLNATPPVTSVAAKTGDVLLTKSDVGLGNVDNTSDASKPISTLTQTALNAKANQRAALLYDPATKSNGQLAATFTADTGQAMTAFTHNAGGVYPNSAPLSISGGTIVHTPVAGTSAGYIQADLGGRVRRIGAMVSWPLNALGIFALVFPSAPWGTNTLPNAGFHLSVNGNGTWGLIRYTTSGTTSLATYTAYGRFNSTTWGTGFWPLEVWLDPDNQKAVITWPDGTTSTVTSPYFASETSNYAVWELFENNGSTDVSASIGAIWADTAPTTPDITALTAYRSPGRNAPAAFSASGAVTVNLAQANVVLVTLTGNITSLAFSNASYMGAEVELHLVQDATGSRTLSGVSSSIKWAGAAAPTLTTTANRRDIFRFRYYGTFYFEISRSMNVG